MVTQIQKNKLYDYVLSLLKVGDILLYNGSGFISWAIKTKTWSHYSHISVYIGNGMVRESKEFCGIREVPLDIRGLKTVRRPIQPYDKSKVDCWFPLVEGQPYDYAGIFLSFFARWQGRFNGKMFCSEYATRDQRLGGVTPFAPDVDADSVAPADFAKSPAYTNVLTIGE